MGGRHSRSQEPNNRESQQASRSMRASRNSDLLRSANERTADGRTSARDGDRSSSLLQSAQQTARRRDVAQIQRDRRASQERQASRQREDSPRARWLKGAALVLVIAAAVAIILVFMRTCSPEAPDWDESEPAYQSPFDWRSLQRDGSRWAYVIDGETVSRQGIDVSESQLWIDWQAVAEDGIDFAMIRAGYRGTTEGQLYTDEYFSYNLAAAQEAGIDCGVYFFSQAVTTEEAIEEADYVLGLLDGVQLDYPIAFDSEEFAVDGVTSRIADLTRDEMTSIAEAFCKRVKQAGYETMIYGNAHDLARYNKGNWEGSGVWWAEYDEATPSVSGEIDMWQYSNRGQVAGIDTNVDMNLDLRPVLEAIHSDAEDADEV